MGYVALKPLTFAGETRGVGEPVPEAATWANPGAWAASGHVVYLPDGLEDQFVDGLLAGTDVRHLAPNANPHHIAVARMQLRHGAGALPPTSELDEALAPSALADRAALAHKIADAMEPSGEPSLAEAAFPNAPKGQPGAKQKLANRLRSKRK